MTSSRLRLPLFFLHMKPTGACQLGSHLACPDSTPFCPACLWNLWEGWVLLALQTTTITPQILLRIGQNNKEKCSSYRELNPKALFKGMMSYALAGQNGAFTMARSCWEVTLPLCKHVHGWKHVHGKRGSVGAGARVSCLGGVVSLLIQGVSLYIYCRGDWGAWQSVTRLTMENSGRS